MKLPKLLNWFLAAICTIALLGAIWYSGIIVAYFTRHVWDGRFRTFNSLYEEVNVGATRVEVENIIAKHYPAGGKRLPPRLLDSTSASLAMFMHLEHSQEPNCELIEFNFADGKVTDKEYTAD